MNLDPFRLTYYSLKVSEAPLQGKGWWQILEITEH